MTKKKSESPLNILTIIENEDMENIWKNSTQNWDEYFNIKADYVKSIDNNTSLNRKYDVIFIEYSLLSSLETKLHSKFSKFRFIVLKDVFEENDYKILKQLVDDIIYFQQGETFVKWKSIAELRRFWKTHSKGDLIIYGSLVMDFVKAKVWANGKEIKLTQKENELLQYFYENKGVWLERIKIFKDVWEYDSVTYDFTRTIDQMIFKLKKKIGVDHFETRRLGGVKFE